MKRLIIVCLIALFGVSALLTVGGEVDAQESQLGAEEIAALGGAEEPQTIAEQVQDVVSDDAITVHSEDGRTIIMMEGEPNDEFTLSFSKIAKGVAANVKLGKGGLGKRFTLVKPEGQDTPVYLDLVGPAVNGGAGVKMTIRF